MLAFVKCWCDCWCEKQNHLCQLFFVDVIFSFTSKVQNYQNKTGEKYLYPCKHVCTTFQMYMFYSLLLANYKQRRKCNHLYWFLQSAMFQQVLYPIRLELIWSYNDLASILRHYCSVSYRNSLSKIRISGNVFYVFECTSPCHLLN